MNPSADESLAFFKTNREVRLERILRAFIALDNGDEPYWWKVERSALIADAKDEVIYRGTDPNAAPQALSKEIAGSDRAHPAIDPTGEPAVAASNTPLTDANVLTEIPAHMWVDRDGVKRDRVLADFARSLEIELAQRDAEWVKAIHDACSNISPADPQGKPIDPADIKRCVDAHVQICLAWIGQKRWP